MEQKSAPEGPSKEAPLAQMVANALVRSRQITKLSVQDYASRMSGALRRRVTAREVADGESGATCPLCDYLVAAGLLSSTAVSVLLGEWSYDAEKIDHLEKAVEALQRLPLPT